MSASFSLSGLALISLSTYFEYQLHPIVLTLGLGGFCHGGQCRALGIDCMFNGKPFGYVILVIRLCSSSHGAPLSPYPHPVDN